MTYVLTGFALVLLACCGTLVWFVVKLRVPVGKGKPDPTSDVLTKALDALTKGAGRDLPADIEARFGSIERRQSQLEEDCLTYLRRGSQRYEQAKRREKRLAEGEEDLEAEDAGLPPGAKPWEQTTLAFPEGPNGEATLDQVRARLYPRG